MSDESISFVYSAINFLVEQGLNVGNISNIQGFVLGPLVGFIAQYQLIKKAKSVGSFSIDVCAILLFANILRIFFWFEKRFETTLLIQSFLMILMQVQLLTLCLYFQQKQLIRAKDISFFNDPFGAFWRWTNLESYLVSLVSFTIGVLLICLIFTEIPMLWELIGFASCVIESCLGLPQALKNHSSKSVIGLSYTMIMSWFFGDAFKTFYYIVKAQPFQFIMCGVVQLSVDIWIVLQIALYKKSEVLEL